MGNIGAVSKEQRKIIGAILQQAREHKGLTQSNMAQSLEYANVNFISSLENGRASIPIKKAEDIVKAYGLSHSFILAIFKYTYPDLWEAFLGLVVDLPKTLPAKTKKSRTVLDKYIEDSITSLKTKYHIRGAVKTAPRGRPIR